MATIRILYVDDNPLDRAVVRSLLNGAACDFALTEVATGEEFRRALESGAHDVVLIDLHPGPVSGIDILDLATSLEPPLPVVVVAGTGSEELAAESIKRGATDYVPRSPEHLQRLPLALQSAVEAQRLRRERQRLDQERDTTIALLTLVNEAPDQRTLTKQICALLQEWSGCEAVGIRWKLGDDYPYLETTGFAEQFVLRENCLCERDESGGMVRDREGRAALECLCGRVLRGHLDPALPFFTSGGSFWTNNTTRWLDSTTTAERPARTRNRCNGAGYESVALIPMRYANEVCGLIQLNDKRPDRFTAESISYLERMAGGIATGLVHHQTRAELSASEERYRSLFDGMLEGVAHCRLVVDAAGRPVDWVYLDVNPACERLTGLHDIVGKRASEAIPGVHESSPELLEIYGRVALTGHPERFMI